MSDPAEIELSITGTPDGVRAGLARLRAWSGGDAGFRDRLEIVLAEVLNNIVEHAYQAAPGNILLHLRAGPDGMECRVTDLGLAMQAPLASGGPVPCPAHLPEGGFGWFLIRDLAEDLGYSRDNARNLLAFRLPLGRMPDTP